MKRLTLVTILLLLPHICSSQPRTAWAKYYRGPYTGSGNWSCGYQVLTDASGNVYVGGYSPGTSGNYELMAIKYTPKGEEAWVRRWTSSTPGNAYMYDMAMDGEGNTYLVGCTKGYDAFHNKVDQFTVVAFSAKGETLWTSTPFQESSCAFGVEVDPFGRIVATGNIGSQQQDLITVRYGGNGDTIWTRRYDYQTVMKVPKPQNDGAMDLAVDATGNVYVIGYTDRDTSAYVNGDILLVGYSRDGALIVAGAVWGNGGHDDWGDAIRIDTEGRVAIAGTAEGLFTPGKDFFISNGGWIRYFDGEAHSQDWAYDVALDKEGNIITVGRTMNMQGNFDFGVVKYSGSGDSLWSRTYDGPGHDEDRAFKVSVDAENNIYVTGVSDGGFTEADWATIKYSPSGEQLWVVRQEGQYEDYPAAITVRGKDIYVTGRSGPFGENDCLTIRYAPDIFRPDRDGWQFKNSEENMWPQTWWSQFDYTKPPYPFLLTWPPFNATSADFPDWPLFADIFGESQCYKKAGNGLYYLNPRALLNWRCEVEGNKARDSVGNLTSYWSGSCAGFAISALRYYNDLLSLEGTLGDFANVYSVPINDESRYLVNKHQIMPLSTQHYLSVLTASQALAELNKMLIESYMNNRNVYIEDCVTGAGHEVVACSLAAVGGGFWELSIYDPNYPGTYMHLNYQEVTEEWASQDLTWNNLKVYLRNPIEEYSSTPILPATLQMAAAPGAASDTSASIFNSPYTDIRLHNAAGQAIGFANGVLIDSMPGAYHKLHSGGAGHPPVGYVLPPGDYTAQITKSLDSTAYFAVFLDSAAFSFHRQGAKSADNEILRFSTGGESLSITNADPASKPLFLQSIETSSGEETVCRLHVQAMPAADSIGIQLVGDRNVALFVGTAGLTADLHLELVKDYANPVFEYAELGLEAGASYCVAPVWDSLATLPLRIYVDRDRDGTVDDTLHLENQTTGVPQGHGELIPDHYELQQNYPNPFNSGTLLTYKVPEKSNVRLSVYDILGREVAVLVDEVKAPGIYTVRLDASSLSSGVYLCRLTAGLYAKTVKMALIR